MSDRNGDGEEVHLSNAETVAASTGLATPEEAEIIAAYKLPDEHCARCHRIFGIMSSILVGDRQVSVCCAVADYYTGAVNHE